VATEEDSSRYSHKAIWAASLAGGSLLLLSYMVIAAALRWGGIGPAEKMLIGAFSIVGFVGTVLGWVAMSDIRAHRQRLRGLPLAAFGALAWPILLLIGASVLAASPYIYSLRGVNTQMPLIAVLLMVVAAGLPTFGIWMAYTTVRWASGQQATRSRGVLRWIFAALLLFGVAVVSARMASRTLRPRAFDGFEAASPAADTNAWVRFTFTAVEFREEGERRWLAFDYVDHVQGVCEPAFRNETTIPGFIPQTRKSSFLVRENEPPSVRHQRIEFLLPASTTSVQGQQIRNDLKNYIAKSVKVDAGTEKPLFDVPLEGGRLVGWIGAVTPVVPE
jgi:hypothetical protein